jgi:hypothetical protein
MWMKMMSDGGRGKSLEESDRVDYRLSIRIVCFDFVLN